MVTGDPGLFQPTSYTTTPLIFKERKDGLIRKSKLPGGHFPGHEYVLFYLSENLLVYDDGSPRSL